MKGREIEVFWFCAGGLVERGAVVGEPFEDLVDGFVATRRGWFPGAGPGLDVGGELFDAARN
jgi:hypothetical protein